MKRSGGFASVCLGVLMTGLCAGSVYAQGDEAKFYAVQVGAFSTESAAAEQRDALRDTTAFIRQEEGKSALPYKLCVGWFSTYMDAWAVKSSAADPVSKGFIVELASDEAASRSSSDRVALEKESLRKAFPFEGLPARSGASISVDQKSLVGLSVPEEKTVITAELTSQPVSEMNRSELLAVGMSGRNNTTGTLALTEFLEKFPDDQAKQAARLRLARRLLAKRDFAGAKDHLSQIEYTGNSEEIGKARLVRAYIHASEEGHVVAYGAFKSVANDETFDAELRSHAMRMAASHAHSAREYTTAVLAYNQIIEESPVVEDQMEARLQRCAAMFELAGRDKGKWNEVIRECSGVRALPDVPEYVRMGTSLMEFEACRFDNDFSRSYQLGKAFLEEWGDDPGAYDTRQMRQYINTARLFQMQNAYVVGQDADALAIASGVVARPPAEREQYPSGNTFLYACVVGSLTSAGQQAADFESKGRAFNDAYFTMLRTTMNELKAKHGHDRGEGSVGE